MFSNHVMLAERSIHITYFEHRIFKNVQFENKATRGITFIK